MYLIGFSKYLLENKVTLTYEQSLESQKLDPLANKQNYLHDNIPTKAQKETKVLISFRLFPDFSYAFVDIDKSHFPLDTQALLPLWTFLSKILVIGDGALSLSAPHQRPLVYRVSEAQSR